MNKCDAELELVFNESIADKQLVLRSSWKGIPGRKAPDLIDVGHGKKRLAALAILFLLSKYRENRREPEFTFSVKIEKLTWICTLTQNFEDVEKWIRERFHIPDSDMFIEHDYGSTHNDGYLYPAITFLPGKLPLHNVSLYRSSKHSPNSKVLLQGRMLLDLALRIEQKHWPRAAVSAVRMLEAADDVREFLDNLAKRGLVKRMLFPPLKWEGREFREFCIEPRLITEAQWKKHQQAKPEWKPVPHEMELPSEKTIRENFDERTVPLGRVLGDECHAPRHRRVILRGHPGEGKSTSLWMHVGNQCAALISQINSDKLRIDDPEFKVPLVFSLGDMRLYQTGLVTKAVENVLKVSFGSDETIAVRIVRNWLRNKVDRAEYTLALDALDELSVPEGIDGEKWLREQIQNIPHHVPILLTARPNTFDIKLGLSLGQSAGQYEIYRMTCFDNRQVTNYVRNYFGEDSEKATFLLNRLRQSPGPKQLAQLPLLLAVLCHVHEVNDPKMPLPATRTELLGAALKHLFASGDRKRAAKYGKFIALDPLRDRLKEALLRRIAWRFWKDGPELMGEGDLHEELRTELANIRSSKRVEYAWAKEAAKQVKRSGLVEELCEDGIFVQILAGGQNHYRFVLRSIHEYLVAGYLASQSKSVITKQVSVFVRGRGWTEKNWRYIWPLAAGQGPHIAKQFLSAFDPPRNVIWRGNCFDKSAPEFLAAIVSESKSAETSYWVEQLDECAGGRRRYSAAKENPIGTVHAGIAGALGIIGGCFAQKVLIDWLFDKSHYPRFVTGRLKRSVERRTVEALANIASLETKNILMQRLFDRTSNPEYRYRSADVLGQIGDIPSRNALIACLEDFSDDEEGWLRGRCAMALGKVADVESRSVLVTRLCNDADDYSGFVRFNCAYALGEIGDNQSRDVLIGQMMNVKNTGEIREQCARSLGIIADAASRSALVACLNNPSNDEEGLVRHECAVSLGIVADIESRSALIARLHDPSDDDTGYVRLGCALALGSIRGDQSRDALIEQMINKANVRELREECANSLGRIADSISRAALIACLREYSDDDAGRFRCACVRALGMIADIESRSELIAALQSCPNDPYGNIRANCAFALGYIRDDESRAALITRLHDPTNDPAGEVRVACVRALVRMGDVEARKALVQRLDGSSDARLGFLCGASVKPLAEIGRDETSIAALVVRAKNPADDPTGAICQTCIQELKKLGIAVDVTIEPPSE